MKMIFQKIWVFQMKLEYAQKRKKIIYKGYKASKFNRLIQLFKKIHLTKMR